MPNEEVFDSLADYRRKLAQWRYPYNNVRPHSLLGNNSPSVALRTPELLDGSASGARALPETGQHQAQWMFVMSQG
jgi:putative transposase